MKSWLAQGSSGRRVTLLPGTTFLHINGASGVYPGSISDKTIVQQSGLLNFLTVEDLVVADKGFLIQKNPCRELQ